MYNLLIALGIGVLTTAGFGFLFGGGSFKLLYGLIPGILTLLTAYLFLARRILKRVESVIRGAQSDLQNQHVDRAIAQLRDAYPLTKWQFFLRAQIDGQIGSILYMTKRFDEAEPYLKRSFKRNWVPRAMLGALYYKQKKYDDMKQAFEEAVGANKKQALLWNLYAYCLWKINKRDEAIEVLNRAAKVLENDEKTQSNLKALKNNRKMKMRGWNMMWYQFHLDRPPAQRQVQFRRR